jgi:ribosomal protein S18 acetylase RimI-like enzyme
LPTLLRIMCRLTAETDNRAPGTPELLSPSLPDAAYIHFVGVSPSFRGNGLARRLYERFFALAAADARQVVRAITAPQNGASIAFHTAMGFTVTAPIPHYDGESSPKVIFERRLPVLAVRRKHG